MTGIPTDVLRRVFEGTSDAIVGVGADGRISIINSRTEKMFGYRHEELIGKPVEVLLPEAARGAHRQHRRRYSQAPQSRPMGTGLHLRGLRKDGSEIPVDISLSPLQTDNGIVVVAAIRDMTDRERIQEVLRVKSAELQAVLDALTTFLDTGDWQEAARHVLGHALRQSESRFGFAGAVVDGPALRILAHEGLGWAQEQGPQNQSGGRRRSSPYLEFTDFENLFGSVIVTRKPVLSNDPGGSHVSIGLPAGHPPLTSFLGVPILQGGEVVGLICVANRPGGYTDIEREKLEVLTQLAGVLFDHYRHSEREMLLEEQLRQSQRVESIGRLAGGIAHDFNNLLTVILGYCDVLLEAHGNGDRGPLRQIHGAAERASALTRQLLAFSRKQVLQPRVLNLNAVVTNLNEMLTRILGEDIRLSTALDPALWPVKADRGQIEQVLLNLVVNARDAMPNGGTLRIETGNVELGADYAGKYRTVAPGPHVALAVTDSGCGMDRETLAHVFEPFFTTKELGRGTGLGLATVYGIVKQSGGSIWVHSEPGQGATFKIYLPRGEGAPLEPEAPTVTARHRGSGTVLLVEDDEGVRELATAILERNGYKVLTAQSGDEALGISRRCAESIDLLLTDIVMPGMSGPDLARQIAAAHPQARIVYMSGYTSKTMFQHGVLDSRMHFIEKPFSPEGLLGKLRQAMDSDMKADPGPN